MPDFMNKTNIAHAMHQGMSPGKGIFSVDVFGVRLDAVTYDEILRVVDVVFETHAAGIIAYSHFHILLQARKDNTLRALLNGADINHPDGMGAMWAIRLLSGRKIQRVNGTDLYPLLIRHLAEANRSMFFLGGKPDSIDHLQDRLRKILPSDPTKQTPRVEAQHGYFALRDRSVPDSIAAAQPDVLFVGLGSPKQFEWLRMYRSELRVPLIVLTGGGIEFLSGTRARAPGWMRGFGLEWIHRLFLEPGHVWKRYCFGIPKFTFLLIREMLLSRQ